jgi:hypothetical protein
MTLGWVYSVVAWFALCSKFCCALVDALAVRCCCTVLSVAAEQRKGKPDWLQFHVETNANVLQPSAAAGSQPRSGFMAAGPKLTKFLDISRNFLLTKQK